MYQVREDQNLPELKQQHESIPACEGSNFRETGLIHNYPGQLWEMSYRRPRDSQQMDRILPRTI